MLYFSYSKGTEDDKMKKYNLSEIMKNAWAMFRKGGRIFADCLRQAWAIAKKPAKKHFDGNATSTASSSTSGKSTASAVSTSIITPAATRAIRAAISIWITATTSTLLAA